MALSSAIIIYFLFGLILMPKMCMASVTEAINLCLSVVVPSLFPFFVCSKVLVKNGFAKFISQPLGFLMRPVFNVPGCGAFAFVIGILGGCPVGAKTVVDMYNQSLCTKAEAQRMLGFCNNTGPLFILGAVSVGMLGFGEIGGLLYFSHILSAIIVGIILSRYKRCEVIGKQKQGKIIKTPNYFATSVSESVSLTGYVCGFVIFFAVGISILRKSGCVEMLVQNFSQSKLWSAAIYGMLEMTNGISTLIGQHITTELLSVVSFIIGLGGLSKFLQVYGIISKHGFSFTVFLLSKIAQAIISAILTYIFVVCSDITLPTFAADAKFDILNCWAISINIFAVFGIIIVLLSIIRLLRQILRWM